MATRKKTKSGLVALFFTLLTAIGSAGYYLPGFLFQKTNPQSKQDDQPLRKFVLAKVKDKVQTVLHETKPTTQPASEQKTVMDIPALGCTGSLTMDKHIRVESVPAQSPAAALGLQPADVILTIDGNTVDSSGAIAMGLHKVGLVFSSEIRILRQNQQLELTIRRNVKEQLILVRTKPVNGT